MSTSIFCVETTCNVLELGHYVIRNLWIVFSHVTTFLSGALLVHITYIKTTKTTTVQRGDNEGFYGRFLAVGRPVSVIKEFWWQEYIKLYPSKVKKWGNFPRRRLTNWQLRSVQTEFFEHGRDCGKHFISGEAAKLWDRNDPCDWVPTPNLGLEKCDPAKQLPANLEAVVKEYERAERSRADTEHVRRRREKIESKKPNVYEPG